MMASTLLAEESRVSTLREYLLTNRSSSARWTISLRKKGKRRQGPVPWQ
jgi:hypothetical protein